MKIVTLGFCPRILGRLCPARNVGATVHEWRRAACVVSRNRLASAMLDTRRRGAGYFVAPISPPSGSL